MTDDERLAKVRHLDVRRKNFQIRPDWFNEGPHVRRAMLLRLERDELRLLCEMAADALEGLGDETTAPILRACLENLDG